MSHNTVPDDMVLEALTKRLSQLDCSSKGWILHGFPMTRDQAEGLAKAGHQPNRYVAFRPIKIAKIIMFSWLYRVYFLDIPPDSVLERLTLQRLDPLTGER